MSAITTSRARRGRPLRVREVLAAAAGAALLVAVSRLAAPRLPLAVAVAVAVVLVGVALLHGRKAPPGRIGVVLVGVAPVAFALAKDLADSPRMRLVGRVGPATDTPDELWLGPVRDLRKVLESRRIDLLVLSDTVPRLEVFDVIERSCRDLPVRLTQLSEFYERQFKHVPVASINSAWFQWMLHPRHRVDISAAKRAFDVVVALVLLVLTAPVVLLAALLIRLDGGPALYRQTRIGERGRPFAMLKLRTMDHRCHDRSTWTSAEDQRITRVGRLLRRTHFDELPQLINVLRGEMSIVGPRPEQPQYVLRLEQSLPFYSRRHQIRPGITGWAQIHCGYAGSDRGSVIKLAYDLYYLKKRTFVMDLCILLRTLVVPFRGGQFAEPAARPLIFGLPDQRSAQIEQLL